MRRWICEQLHRIATVLALPHMTISEARNQNKRAGGWTEKDVWEGGPQKLLVGQHPPPIT
jgi:hypothetical protein